MKPLLRGMICILLLITGAVRLITGAVRLTTGAVRLITSAVRLIGGRIAYSHHPASVMNFV